MLCVIVAESFQQIATGASHTILNQASFFFNIPEHISIPSDQTGVAQNLPPSMRVLQYHQHVAAGIFSKEAMNSCDISYHLRARGFRGGRQVCQTRQEVIIMPVTDLPPPLAPEDFKGEFQLLATWQLKPHLKQKENIQLTVSSLEPRPIVFPVSERETGSTDVLLYFETGMLAKKIDEKAYVETHLRDCRVSITLNATTYFLAQEQLPVMSTAELVQSSSAFFKKTKYKMKRRKMQLKWENSHDTTRK